MVKIHRKTDHLETEKKRLVRPVENIFMFIIVTDYITYLMGTE